MHTFDEKKWATIALQIQIACNLSGVASSLQEMMHEMCLAGWDNRKRDNHPCTILIVSKIHSLVPAGYDFLDLAKAFDACTLMAE